MKKKAGGRKTSSKKKTTRKAPGKSETTTALPRPDPNRSSLQRKDQIQIPTLRKESIVPYLAALLLICAGALVVLIYRSYVWPAFIALLLYVGFYPIYLRLVSLLRSRNLAAAATTMIVVIAIVLPGALLIQHLAEEIYDVVIGIRESVAAPRLLSTIADYKWIGDLVTSDPFFWVSWHSALQEVSGDFLTFLDTDSLGSWVGGVFTVVKGSLSVTWSIFFNLLLALILLFFLLRDGHSFYLFLRNALPFPPELTDRFTNRMRDLIATVLRGNVFVSFLQGLAISIGLTICGINNSAVYGLIAAVFSLIPIVGTAVVWAPAAAYLVVSGSWGYAVFLAIYGVCMYLLLENIVKPKLMDRKLGLHPMLLFFAILGGLTEFGVSGVVLGPLFVTFFMTLWSIYHIWDTDDRKT